MEKKKKKSKEVLLPLRSAQMRHILEGGDLFWLLQCNKHNAGTWASGVRGKAEQCGIAQPGKEIAQSGS